METRLKKRLSRPVGQGDYASTARELLLQVQVTGGDVQGVLHRAGLRLQADTLLGEGWNGPLSRASFARLYAECTWVLDETASRQEGRAPLTKPELDMLCYCIITCTSLRAAIHRAAAFSLMLMPRTARLTLTVEGRVAEFRMSTVRRIRNASAFVSDLTGLATHHRLFGWLIGMDLPLLGVGLCYPPHLSAETSWRLMPHEISYGAPDNILRFPASYLDCPVVRSPAELDVLLEHFPFDVDEEQARTMSLAERVRIILEGAGVSAAVLPTGSELARRFSISPATLKRRLAEEGTSLGALKDDSRCKQAMRLLDNPAMPISEIAMLVGFQDSTAFSRAFRRWTGSSPSVWRRAPGTENSPAPG